uniref:hybrid sensor histidine kinase/response regulator n=1 Tax=Dokdonella sp. TaxID=2291710 RepID=UPI00260549E0
NRLRVGVPVVDLVRWNIERGLAGGGDREAEVAKRIAHMRAGTPYVAERMFPGGRVVEIRGNPMPGGGFVATFTDVTAFRRAERELTRANETLEQRVAARTDELARASAAAERANRDKTRFLAAVSHDLAQPLHAAHLFTHALARRVGGPERETVAHIDGALSSAESLLGGLLDISRLDAGGMPSEVRAFDAEPLLLGLAAEFRLLAEERCLQLRCVPTRAWLRSDPQLLRRVLQNFLSNAVKYTRSGSVLLGCRRRGDALRIEVWDSGSGIAEQDRALVFEEFRRLDRGGVGLGLGLSIAERIARLLGHALTLRSWPGRGSVFAIEVPRAAAQSAIAVAPMPNDDAAPRRVLVVDNDISVAAAMRLLLEGWHCEVLVAHDAASARDACARAQPDLLVLDYHLDDGATGLDLRAQLGASLARLPCIVVSADHGDEVRRAVARAGAHLLHKPLKPLALKSLMARLIAVA